MGFMMLMGILLTGALLWGLFLIVSRGTAAPPVSRREQAELAALRELIDDLKETAWEHRELDSALSTILIDKIREHERRRRELG